MDIQPLEDFIFAGFSKRYQQVFGCICIYTTATDKTKAIAKMFEGHEVTYPYACFSVQSLGPNTESYNPQSLARRGLDIAVNGNTLSSARILPTNFEVEIEYHTNKFQGFQQGSVLAYARRWLFARRLGYLKFNVNYGRLQALIGVTMADSVPIPPRESMVEQEPVYKIVSTATIHGYSSEPSLKELGVVQSIEVNGMLIGSDGSIPGAQFFSFSKEP